MAYCVSLGKTEEAVPYTYLFKSYTFGAVHFIMVSKIIYTLKPSGNSVYHLLNNKYLILLNVFIGFI